MKKETLLTVLVIALAIINIVVVGFMLMQKKGHPPRPHGDNNQKKISIEFLQNQFDIQDKDIDILKMSIEENVKGNRETQEILNEYSKMYYLIDKDNDAKDSLMNLIINTTKNMYAVNEKHIADIRSIAENDSPEVLENFVSAAVNRGSRNQPKGKRGRKK